jgi:ketosteroid isomerase-like protein
MKPIPHWRHRYGWIPRTCRSFIRSGMSTASTRHLMRETFSKRKLSPRDVAVHVYGNSAWVEFDWDFVAKFRKDRSPITTHGRETQVYWKMPDGRRLVHVQSSGMPVTQERLGF